MGKKLYVGNLGYNVTDAAPFTDVTRSTERSKAPL